LGKDPLKIMSTENFILLNWDEQLKNFNTNLLIIRQRPIKKSVHDLRVAVKKMRSFLRLKEEITGDAWEEQFSPVKTLFKTSGKQRDFEMSLSLLLKYQKKENLSLPSFKKFLQVNKSLTQQWTKKAALKFNDSQLLPGTNSIHSSLAALSNEELINKIKLLAQNVIKNVNRLTKDINKNAHEIRKRLKYLYYWLTICPYNPVNDLIEIKLLDKILQNLGDWQDNFIFSKKIKHFRKEWLVKKSIEAKTAEMLEKKISNKKDELLNKAIRALQNSFEKK